ncbi:Outer membrane lipoprotein [uncultured Candidatus Thioglobus sp.]|nr:Outer membrane lipoprotein [uncultured Candidatus Thioglobus sp.]
MKMKTMLIVLTMVFLSACQSSINRFTEDERGANTYSSNESGKFSSVTEGVILSIRQVKISGSKGLGSGAGAILGGVAATNAVGGKGDKVPAAIIGSLLGAMVGGAIEEISTAETGFEFLIKLNNDGIKAFVQNSKQGLKPGDDVYIVYGDGIVRLTRK